jgi:uncharacterized protein (DUF2235 family)
MTKRICLSFDGTWNTPGNSSELEGVGKLEKSSDVDALAAQGFVETNACRMHRSIATANTATMQVKWYDRGVGTKWYERVPGGAFGLGLSRNIREGYKYLSDIYDDGDEVYVFGFSRGAYTARSLVGLIRNAGLLPKGSLTKKNPDMNRTLVEGYELYRTRDDGADSSRALNFRKRYGSRLIEVQCVGVWDTVGALGVPLESFGDFNKAFFEFHDTELSGLVRNAFHAIAVDEHRKPYAPTLWLPKHKVNQILEQRWFIGAHCDVGGGYDDRQLSDLTLSWIQQKVQAIGLELEKGGVVSVDASNWKAPVHDSFQEFLNGLFQVVHTRYYRPVGTGEHSAEVVDEAVRERRKFDPNYRPKNAGLPA